MSEQKKKQYLNINKEKVISAFIVMIIPTICILIGYKNGDFAPFGRKDMITLSKTSEDLFMYYQTFCHDFGLTESALPAFINILYLLFIPLCCLSFYIFINHKFLSKNSIIDSSINECEKKEESLENVKKEKKDIILGGSYLPKSEFGKTILRYNPISIALSIAFGLSIFFLSEGANISILPAIAVFPLIVMGSDYIIEEKSSILFIVFFTISIYLNIYITIISFIFVCLYFTVEIISCKSGILNKLKKFFISSVFALLIGAGSLIPAIMNNSFCDSLSLSFVRPSKINNPWNVFNQLMFNSKISDLNMYNSGVNLYAGLLGLLLFFGFIINKKIKVEKRIGYAAITISMILGTVFSSPNYLFNGFRGFYYYTFMFGYIYTFIMLVMAYECLSNIDGINKSVFSILGLILAVLIFITMKKAEMLDSIKPLYYSIEILFAYYLIIIIFRDKSMSKVLFQILISLICLFEITFTFTSNLVNKGKVAYTRPSIDTTGYKSYTAEKKIKATDKDARILNLEETGVDTNPLLYSLEGYEYILTYKESDAVDSTLIYIDSIKESGMLKPLNIYKNPNVVNSALWNQDITSYKYDINYPFSSSNILSSLYAESDNIFTIIDGNTDANPTSDSTLISFSFSASELGEAYTRAYFTEYIGDDSKINPVSSIQVKPIDRYNEYTFQYALYNQNSLNSFKNKITSETQNIRILPDNKEYNITSSKDGYLSVPIKKSANLMVTVNGSKVITSSLTNATTLIPVKKGNNTIRIYYSNAYKIIGILISLLSVITLVLNQIIINKKKIKNGSYKSKINKLSNFISDNHVYFITIAIMTLIFILCQMYTGSYPFGNKSTIMDDGITQTFPMFVDRARSIKKGNGLSIFINTNMHIWDVIRLKFIPESMYLFDFTFTFYLYYILNPVSLIYYLTKRHSNPYKKNDKRLILLGLLYGLSSYAIIMFVYAGFRLLIYIPIVLLGLEKLIYKRKPLLYIISLAMMMMYDAYPALMLCEMLILFFISYNFDNIKHFIESGTSFALSSFCSAGIAAFRLLPYLNMSSGSGYAETDSVKPSITLFYKSFVTLFSDYRPLTYMRAISDDNSKAAIYVGMLLWVIITLYALNRNIELSTRIKKVLFLIIIYIAFNNVILNYLFHGMHYQSLVPNRFAVFFVFISITMIADVLLSLHEYTRITFVGADIVVLSIYYLIHYMNNDLLQLSTIVGMIILLIPVIVVVSEILIKIIRKKEIKYLEQTIIIVMVLDILINAAMQLEYNIGSSSTLLKEAAYVNNLTEHYPDIKDPYTNTVYLDSSNYNLATLAGYSSPVMFYSGISSYRLNTCNKYNIHYSANTIYYGTGNPLADMMMRVKYHIADSYTNSAPMTIYPKTASINNMNIYENPYILSPGFVIDNSYIPELNQWENREKTYQNIFEYQNSFSNIFINKNIYNQIEICSNLNEETNDSYYIIGALENTSNSQRTSYNLPVYVHINASSVQPGDYYISVLDYITYIGKIENEDMDLSINIPTTRYYSDDIIDSTFSVGCFDSQAMNELHSVLAKEQLDNITITNKGTTADLNTNSDGILYLSTVYSDSTSIKIDGANVQAVPYLGGTVVPVSAGQHTVMIESNTNYMNEGVIISLSTIMILILLCIYIRKKESTKSKEKESDEKESDGTKESDNSLTKEEKNS